MRKCAFFERKGLTPSMVNAPNKSEIVRSCRADDSGHHNSMGIEVSRDHVEMQHDVAGALRE